MPFLDLYKKRRHSTVRLENGIEFKVPNEYTVEEVERLLELKEKEEVIKNTSVEAGTDEANVNIVNYWSNVFAQIEIIFQSLQPDIDLAYIKKNVTHKEALEIVGFFNEYRAITQKTDNQPNTVDVKKKLKK